MNCKPGELAIVIHAQCKENIGLIVKVLPEMDYGPDGHEWLTEAARPTPTVWYHTGRPAFPDRLAWCPDAWLRPIRPGDISDEEVRELYLPKLPEAA